MGMWEMKEERERETGMETDGDRGSSRKRREAWLWLACGLADGDWLRMAPFRHGALHYSCAQPAMRFMLFIMALQLDLGR